MDSSTFEQEFVIRSIKIVDIVFIAVIYFFMVFYVSTTIDAILGPFQEEDQIGKTKFRLFFEIAVHVGIIGIFGYIIRNLVEFIPFPLDGIRGYQHEKTKELSGGLILSFVFFYFQDHLKAKLKYYSSLQ